MRNKAVLILLGVFFAALSGTAAARDNISFSLSLGVPGYAYAPPAPAYYYPPPHPRVYYAPAATYYAPPATVYYAPPAPVYYAPAPWAAREYRGHRGHHRGWQTHHKLDDEHRGHRGQHRGWD